MLSLKFRRTSSIIITLLILVLSLGGVYADFDSSEVEFQTDHISVPKSDTEGEYILTREQLSELESRIQESIKLYGTEHFLVLNFTHYAGGSTVEKREFAKEIYRQHRRIDSDDASGSILFVDFNEDEGDREILIVTFGGIVDSFQPKVDSTLQGAIKHLRENEFYEAFNYYLDQQVTNSKSMGKLDDTGNVVPPSLGKLDDTGNVVPPSFFEKFVDELKEPQTVGIAAFIAVLICIIPLFTYKGSNKVSSRTYEVEGLFQLTTNTDVYSHSHTTKVYDPPKSSSSSGGGSGSSGGTGGGSAKF